MRGKILFLAGVGVGYVLGTRAGRERYEQIKKAAAKLWADPRIQDKVATAEEFVRDKAPEVVGFIADGAKTVAAKVGGRTASSRGAAKSSRGAAKKPARKPAAKSAPKASASSGSAESKPSSE